jgi:hypothetical protein
VISKGNYEKMEKSRNDSNNIKVRTFNQYLERFKIKPVSTDRPMAKSAPITRPAQIEPITQEKRVFEYTFAQFLERKQRLKPKIIDSQISNLNEANTIGHNLLGKEAPNTRSISVPNLRKEISLKLPVETATFMVCGEVSVKNEDSILIMEEYIHKLKNDVFSKRQQGSVWEEKKSYALYLLSNSRKKKKPMSIDTSRGAYYSGTTSPKLSPSPFWGGDRDPSAYLSKELSKGAIKNVGITSPPNGKIVTSPSQSRESIGKVDSPLQSSENSRKLVASPLQSRENIGNAGMSPYSSIGQIASSLRGFSREGSRNFGRTTSINGQELSLYIEPSRLGRETSTRNVSITGLGRENSEQNVNEATTSQTKAERRESV